MFFFTKSIQEAIGNKTTPLLQCHGDCDPIVPYKWGQMTASLLKQFMTQTEFKSYRGMMHTSCEEVSGHKKNNNFLVFTLHIRVTISHEFSRVLFLFCSTGNARYEEIHRKSREAVIAKILIVTIF